METYRLPADAAIRPDPVSSGWAHAIHRGPRTIAEVLRSAGEAMDEEDRQQAAAADRIAYIGARRPRRRLLDLLLGRR